MALTSEFIDAVKSGKKTRVRIMLKDIMLVDTTMNQFEEMLNYANSNIMDLYDEHDDEKLVYDKTAWNETYLNKQMVTVVNNFSKDRIELLRNMVKYIYRDKANRPPGPDKKKVHGTRKQVGTGVAAAGAVATVAGVCAHSGILIVGGVVVAAVGVGMIITDKG